MNRMFRWIFVLFLLSTSILSYGQKKSLIAFYNFENLYDTIDQPDVQDEEFLPDAPKQWTGERYRHKLQSLARVVSQIGACQQLSLPDVLGVCEVENQGVLNDLIKEPVLKKVAYRVVHNDSPDKRGIDVALLYNPKAFEVLRVRCIPLTLTEDSTNNRFSSRDQLVVSGKLHGDAIHVVVNHWPSRMGGEKSSGFRSEAARLTRMVTDSILHTDAKARIVVMGDFNDNPTDSSVADDLLGLDISGRSSGLWNAGKDLYADGKGSLVYRNEWFLFDQIIVSKALKDPRRGLRWIASGIVAHDFMLQTEGRYKGFPSRTYAGKRYLAGYSDHLPVYIVLQKGGR